MKTVLDSLRASVSSEAQSLSSLVSDRVLHFDIEAGGLDPKKHGIFEYGIKSGEFERAGFITPPKRYQTTDIDPWVWKNLAPNADPQKINTWKDFHRSRLTSVNVTTAQREMLANSIINNYTQTNLINDLTRGLTGRNLVIANVGYESKMLAAQLSDKNINILSSAIYMNQPMFKDSKIPDKFKKFYPEGNQQLDTALFNASRTIGKRSNRRAWADIYNPWISTALDTQSGKSYVLDLQDLIRSNIAQAQIRGVLPKHPDLFTGTSVDFWSHLLEMGSETHVGIQDVSRQEQVLQSQILIGQALRDKKNKLPKEVSTVFAKMEEMLPAYRKYNAVKTLAEYIDNPQGFEVTKARKEASVFSTAKGREKHFMKKETSFAKDLDEVYDVVSRRASSFGLDLSSDFEKLKGLPDKEARLQYAELLKAKSFRTLETPPKTGINRILSRDIFSRFPVVGSVIRKYKIPIGLGVGIMALSGVSRLYNRHIKDNTYLDSDLNVQDLTIDGLHPGAGEKSRWKDGFREFGSGYRGMYNAKVLDAEDADTLTILTPHTEILKIRLHGADTPESVEGLYQPFGKEASAYVKNLLPVGSIVGVNPVSIDYYGRTVASITTPEGDDLASDLISKGYAHWYKKYAKDMPWLGDLEREARENKRGMWALPRKEIKAPWDYRAENRALLQEVGAQDEIDFENFKQQFYQQLNSSSDFRQTMMSGLIGQRIRQNKTMGLAQATFDNSINHHMSINEHQMVVYN